MEQLAQLESNVQDFYRQKLHPFARQLALELPATQDAGSGLPTVLFLGNHSSGKSSFINFLLRAPLQKTGLAPTDDGFTIITYGAAADEFDGPALTSHPDLRFNFLQRLGPAFVSKLRLKRFPGDLLKSITLIDSPGMIDAANAAHTRGYDFNASIRAFAEMADLILFFFDPDKPGTTGETVSIFTDTLAGLEYKLLIILNKVDLFSNLRDLMRTYGTLCWNLSKNVRTKDIPHIFTTYLPQPSAPANPAPKPAIPLQDFDGSRQEVIAEILRAPSRRADNLVTDLNKNALKLAMHARVLRHISFHYRKRWWIITLAVTGVLALAALAAWLCFEARSRPGPLISVLSGFLLASLTGWIGTVLQKHFRASLASPERLDRFFESAYARELTLDHRADLRALWLSLRRQTLNALQVLGPHKASPFGSRKKIKKLDRWITDAIPNLRRQAARSHQSLA